MKLKSVVVRKTTFKHKRGTTKRATSKRRRITVKRKRITVKRKRVNKKYLYGGNDTPENNQQMFTTPKKQLLSTPPPDRSDPLNPGYSFMPTPQDVAENPLNPSDYAPMSSPEQIGSPSDLEMPNQYASMPSPSTPTEKKERKIGERPTKPMNNSNLPQPKKLFEQRYSP